MEGYKEVSKEEILGLEENKEYLVYNPLTDTWHKEVSGRNDIAHNKYAYDKLKYYIKVGDSND